MNEDLLQVRNWCFGNRLLLYLDKTKLIVFGSPQMTSKFHEFHLSLLGKDISPAQSARDLGVILDPNLTFDSNITTPVSECIARLAQINRVKHRPVRLTQCCTQLKSSGVKIFCVLYLHYNVVLTFKWYGNSWNKTFYPQRVWIGYNI